MRTIVNLRDEGDVRTHDDLRAIVEDTRTLAISDIEGNVMVTYQPDSWISVTVENDVPEEETS
jgi:hypothetical protein